MSIGHAETPDHSSGVTAVLFDAPAPMVVDVRGGASATYDTASLSLEATFGRRWAIFFSGGSLYGLDAARGIRTRILETGGGHRAFSNPNVVVPISGAALFDLPRQKAAIPDYLPLGYEAARTATRGRVTGGAWGPARVQRSENTSGGTGRWREESASLPAGSARGGGSHFSSS